MSNSFAASTVLEGSAEGRNAPAAAERAKGFLAGRKWAEKPAEYDDLRRIVEMLGESAKGRPGSGGYAPVHLIAAAYFRQHEDPAKTGQFWAKAAQIEQPGEDFVEGFYEGLKFVFDEVNLTASR